LARRILGLDIGSHTIKAVELRQTLRGLELVQLRSLSLEVPSPAPSRELRDLVQIYDLPSEAVIASLPGDRLSTHPLRFPFRDARKIAAAVPFEIDDQTPFDLSEYVLDWETAAWDRDHAEVSVTLVPRAEVAQLLETLQEADLNPRVVEAEGSVLANLTALFELPGARLLADVGHRKTTLCLCVEGRPMATRSVPIAGKAFTDALAAERGIGELEAEGVKIEHGVFGRAGAETSPQGMAVADRLAREIARTLGAFEPILARHGGGLEHIDLLGGSAHLHGLDVYLQEQTGIATRRIAPPGGALGQAFLAAGDPALFAPAAALALRGSARATTGMDFRQDELARRIDLRKVGRELRWTAALFACAVGLALGSVAAKAVIQDRRADALEVRAGALYHEAFPADPVPEHPVAALQASLQEAEHRANTLGVYRGNLSALDLLSEISKRIPKGLDVVFEELLIDRQGIQIEGHSTSFGTVDQLRAELEKFPPFQEIGVGDITRDSRRGGQSFSVRIRLAPEGGAS